MKYRRHQAKPYKTAGKSMIPDRVSIHERRAEADGIRYGDWERDLVIGAVQNSAVLTKFKISERVLTVLYHTVLYPFIVGCLG